MKALFLLIRVVSPKRVVNLKNKRNNNVSES
jgi:hypothetical protein